MNAALIQKLNLKPTDHSFGQSVIYKVVVYSLFENFYFAECNSLGEKTEGKFILWHKDKPQGYKYVYEEFLLDMPVEVLKKVFN